MADRLPEQESLSERIVSLGQEFLMFDPRFTKGEFNERLSVEQFKGGKISLDTTGVLSQVQFSLNSFPSRTDKRVSITPFDREIGYTITEEDFKLEDRLIKHESINGKIDDRRAPLHLEIGVTEAGKIRLPQEILSAAKELKVQLQFPNGLMFEAQPDELWLSNGEIAFRSFYPLDTGPLPYDRKRNLWMTEGLYLFVPSDKELLGQIKVKIVKRKQGEDMDEEIPPKTAGVKDNNSVPVAFKDAFKDDPAW